jgi:hypothetical protein
MRRDEKGGVDHLSGLAHPITMKGDAGRLDKVELELMRRRNDSNCLGAKGAGWNPVLIKIVESPSSWKMMM